MDQVRPQNNSDTNDIPLPAGAVKFMRLALTLARKAQGYVEPNPMVGAVIVRNNIILGQGYHERYGQSHAEVNAISDARLKGHDITGADMYVTLEPCAHWGKTPPCADAVVEAGIGRVFCAMIDPFPEVSGKGISLLKQNDIKVHVGLLGSEALQLNAPFFKRLNTGLPFVMLKWAQSVDGKIASAKGDSKWISGPSSRKRVHQWRSRVDAIMVGIGTARADDPQLTARGIKPRRVALRVVVDPHLKLPVKSKLLQTNSKGKIIPQLLVATTAVAMQQNAFKAQKMIAEGVEFFELSPLQSEDATASTKADKSPEMDLQPLFKHLAQNHKVTNVLVEGGGKLHGTLIHQQLADELLIFLCPKIIGDNHAPSGIAGISCPTMAQAQDMTLQSTHHFGDDILLVYHLKR